MMLSEADIQVAVKALMKEHKISKEEAYKFMAEYAMKQSKKVFQDINKEFAKGMVKVVDVADSCKYGIDMTRVDPLIRRTAKEEPHLNIHFEDCRDLAMQLAACKRQAGFR